MTSGRMKVNETSHTPLYLLPKEQFSNFATWLSMAMCIDVGPEKDALKRIGQNSSWNSRPLETGYKPQVHLSTSSVVA
ncbi:mCG119959, partial [Mus musculus]